MNIRVILADDHRVFMQGLAALMKENGFEVVGLTADRDNCMEMFERYRPDVAVLDLSMPGASIPQILAQIADRSLPTRVLVLTGIHEPAPAAELMAAGVSGYLLKENAFEELAKAILLVAAGGRYVDAQVAVNVVLHTDGKLAHPAALTSREIEVLRLVAKGDTNKRIAHKLGIHTKTVEHHRQNIRQKLEVHSTAEMIRVAVSRGLL